jgi:hypothetical protein
MLMSADFRILQLLDISEIPFFSILPVLGFSINPIFVNAFSLETALRFRVDIANMFITTLGFAYEDQLWKNGIDFIFNFHVVELGLGIAMQSQDFVSSWQGKGISVNVGLKLGF